ncbi:MAG TPA: hypothetical protein V6D05_00405 [Stenomitos sp.]
MRRLLVWLPILLTACSANLMAPETQLGGPLGRFGHSLTGEPASPAPPAPIAEVAALPVKTPNPRQLVSTPRPAETSPPAPIPTVVPYTPPPEPVNVVLLTPPPPTPRPTPTPTPTPAPRGLRPMILNQPYVTFLLYDDADEDGDRIRVELNDVEVEGFGNLFLTNAGTTMNVELHSGVNYLRFRALSQGEGGPCTFGLRVSPYALVEGPASQFSQYLLTGESETLMLIAP